MSFAAEIKGFISGFKSGSDIRSARADRRCREAQYENIRQPTEEEVENQPDYGGGGGGVTTATPQAGQDGTKTSSTGARKPGGDELAWKDAAPYQKALLNTIAGPESGGRYDVIYGGKTFNDFSDHPRQDILIQTGPNAKRTSSAAGKYQFLGSTWDDQARKLGLKDFSPESQDKAAWNLAAETYKAKTGQSLDDVLQSGDPAALAKVGQILNPIWTSLPGGIEAGTNTDKFVSTFNKHLGSAGAGQGARDAIAEQGGDPNGPLADAAAKLKEKFPEEEETAIDEEEEVSTEPIALLEAAPIETTPVSLDPITGVPQVQTAFAIPELEEVQPLQMFAEQGGIIPEPGEQRFAPGGIPLTSYDMTTGVYRAAPQGQATAQLAQPAPAPVAPVTPAAPASTFVPRQVGGAGGWTPRQVGQPGVSTSGLSWGTGKSPSQLAWANRPKYVAPVKPVAPTPVVQPKKKEKKKKKDTYEYHGSEGKGDRSSAAGGYAGGGGLYQQGGMIPEPDEIGFAKGGLVSFEELLRQEKGDRDRAAKRFNAQKGGPTSSAYDPDGYFQPKPKPKPAAPVKLPGTGEAPTPTPRPDTEKTSSTGDTGGADYSRRHVGGAGSSAASFEHDEPKAQAAGTPTAGYEPKPDEPVIPETPQVEQSGGGVERRETPALYTHKKREQLHQGLRSRYNQKKRDILKRNPRAKMTGEVAVDEPVIAEPPEEGPFRPQRNVEKPVVVEPSGSRFLPQSEDPLASINRPLINQELVTDPETGVVGAYINGQFVPANTTAAPGMGFQEGGIIPEDPLVSERALSANYQTAPAGAVQQEEEEEVYDDVAPTPKLKQDVATAVGEGLQFLKRHFAMGGEGAVATPEDPAVKADSARRFAEGEGKATQEEVAAIDDKIDPERRLSEADRHMTRLAKTMSWYLERGRKEEAGAVAASLMQYGADRSARLGSMAGAALQEFEQSQDPKDLQNTVKFLNKAYEMIPDGSSGSIQISPDGTGLVAVETNAEGEQVQTPISSSQLPAILAGVQDKSSYWKQIYRLADPESYRQEQRDVRDVEVKKQERADALAKEERGNEEFRERTEFKEKLYRERPPKAATLTEADKKAPDPKVIGPLMAQVEKLGEEPEDEAELETWKTSRDALLTQVYDSLPPTADKAKWMEQNFGVFPEDWTYSGTGEPGVAAPVEEAVPEGEPVQNSRGRWVQKYSNGKYAEVAAPAG